jgi:hypothetical protein
MVKVALLGILLQESAGTGNLTLKEGGRQAIEARGAHVISLFTRSSLLDE